MVDEAQLRIDLRCQAFEAARKILASSTKMIEAETRWQRDAFYQETMRHLAQASEQIGKWRINLEK